MHMQVVQMHLETFDRKKKKKNTGDEEHKGTDGFH